jgi:hypothetical protein
MLSADRLYLGVGRYDFFFVRRADEAAPRVFLVVLRRRFTRLAAFVTARRAGGLAALTLLVNSFCTDPALAAIVPRVAPIDSATLVRILSSRDDLWLSTENPFHLHPYYCAVVTRAGSHY